MFKNTKAKFTGSRFTGGTSTTEYNSRKLNEILTNINLPYHAAIFFLIEIWIGCGFSSLNSIGKRKSVIWSCWCEFCCRLLVNPQQSPQVQIKDSNKKIYALLLNLLALLWWILPSPRQSLFTVPPALMCCVDGYSGHIGRRIITESQKTREDSL